MMKKIGLIGGGWIGGVLALECAKRKLAKVIGFVDPAPFVNENDTPEMQAVQRKQSVARGKALDISAGLPLIKSDTDIQASKSYEVLAGSELVISTAGVPRKARPDGTFPSREELLTINLKVTKQVAAAIGEYCPDAIVLNIANPLDAIVYTLNKTLKPPRNKLFGMAGVLDSTRYRYFVAQAAGVSVDNVEAMVFGGHGDDMVPVRSACRIAGLPVQKFLDDDTLLAIETRVRKAGGEVVGLLGFGSAFVSPAWSALEMAEAVVYDKKKILPTCALLQGEYGVKDLYVGVAAILGRDGMEKIIEVDFSEDEQKAFASSVEAVSKTCAEVDRMLG